MPLADEIRRLVELRMENTLKEKRKHILVMKMVCVLTEIAREHPSQTTAQVVQEHWGDAIRRAEHDVRQTTDRAIQAVQNVNFPEDTKLVSFQDYVKQAGLREILSEAELQMMQEMLDEDPDKYWQNTD